MGWSNYLVIPEKKIAFEVNRGIEPYSDDTYKSFSKHIKNFLTDDKWVNWDREKLTQKDLSYVIQIFDGLEQLKGIPFSIFIYIWAYLSEYEIDIIHEDELYRNKSSKYKNFKIINL